MEWLLSVLTFNILCSSGLVVSNELTNTNVLIMDVFTLLFQVSLFCFLRTGQYAIL